MIMNVPRVDYAYDNLKRYQENLIGVYEYGRLQCFESALKIAYQRKIISEKHYEELFTWVRNVYRQMDDDVEVFDVFLKNLWGIVYRKNNQDRVYINAKKESVYLRKLELEEKGYLVSPLFSKQYGYNYTYKLNDARDDFQKDIFNWITDEYMLFIKELMKLHIDFDKKQYDDFLEMLKEEHNVYAAKTWFNYGYILGIFDIDEIENI